MRILYNVTVKIDPAIEKEWLEWMLSNHIPEVMATGCFSENKVCRLLDQDDSDGGTYSFQYVAESRGQYQRYQDEFAPALQKDHRTRYEGKFVAFRTLLQIVG